MRYRPLDQNGDMMPIKSDDEMLKGTDAVAAAINSRLHLLYGQWWQNEKLGFRIPAFLFENTRIVKNVPVLTSYIANYVENTQGVRRAYCSSNRTSRSLNVKVTAETQFGSKTNSVEVSDYVLRSAIS